MSSNLAFVSLTLTLGGDGGSFLFFEFDLPLSLGFRSFSTLLQETDLLILNFPSCSLEVEATGVSSFFSSETSSGFFLAIFSKGLANDLKTDGRFIFWRDLAIFGRF